MGKNNQQERYYDELEVMEVGKREDYYNRKISEQVRYSYENAPAMGDKINKAGLSPSDIRTLKDMEKIPITKKDELIDLRRANPPWGGLIVCPEKVRKIYMSPGPIYEVQSLDDNFYNRYPKRLNAQGFRAGDIIVNTWSYHMVPAGHWFDEAIRRIGAAVIPMGVGNTELQVRVLYDMKATGWIGTSGFLVNIIDKAEEMGYDIQKDFALRNAIAGGEMGGGPIRKRLEEKYGIVCYDGYGTADVGPVAYECTQRNGMHIFEEVFVEIVDPDSGKALKSGEVGEVVVTPFDNTYPILRFGTGDLASYTDEPCSCGRTSLKINRIVGRIGDAVRTRGMFIHPKQIREVMGKFPEILKYQCLVTRPQYRDNLVLRIELAGESVDRERFKAELEKIFPEICRVRLDQIEFVPNGTIPNGAKEIVDNRVY